MNPLDRFLLPTGTPSRSDTKGPEAPTPSPMPLGRAQGISTGEEPAVDQPPVASTRGQLYARTREKKFEDPPLSAFEGKGKQDENAVREPPDRAPNAIPDDFDPSKLTPSQRIAHVLPGSSRVKSSGITLSRLERDAVLAEAIRQDMTFSAYVRACLFSEMHVSKRPHGEKIERLGAVLRNRRKEQWVKQNVEAGLLPDPAAAAPPTVWGVQTAERSPAKPKK